MFNNVKSQIKNFSNKKVGLAAIAAVFVLLAIITTFIGNGSEQVDNISPTQVVNTSQTELLPDNLENIKQVNEIHSLASANGKQVAGIELEYQKGILIYAAVFGDSSIQAYDAVTAEEVEYQGTTSEFIHSYDRLPAYFNPSISFSDALTKAKAQHPDKVATKIALGIETSIAMYNVYFNDSSDLYISANSGNIVTIPDPEPIQYTSANTTPTNTLTRTNEGSSTNNNAKKPSWSTNKKKWKKLVEDYREYYTNLD